MLETSEAIFTLGTSPHHSFWGIMGSGEVRGNFAWLVHGTMPSCGWTITIKMVLRGLWMRTQDMELGRET